MNSMWKRSFALLLSLVMVFGMVPVNAFAEETECSHSYEATVTDPTCTVAGYTTYTCACGDTYTADEVAATGHSHQATVTAPTCGEAGFTTYTCACGDTYTADEVAATGHSYADGVCSVCGAEEPAAEEQNEEEDDEIVEEETVEDEIVEEEPVVCDGTENCPAETHETTCECYDWCAALGCSEETHHDDCPWGPCTLTEGCGLAKGHVDMGIPCEGMTAFVENPVAMIGEQEFGTFEEAVAAAASGDTIELLAEVTLSEEVGIPGGVTLNGNGYQINGSIYAGGNLTFEGVTKVTGFSASYYNHVITIGEGASLEVTGTGRVSLAYGNVFNITGTVADAKNADKSAIQPSLVIPGGISITGGNDATMNVTNAYVKIGSTSSKDNSANGTFTLNFNNAIAEFTSQLTLSEPKSGKNPKFNINIKDSVLTTGTKFIVAVPNTNVVIDNSEVTLASYFRNSGMVTLQNGSKLTGATIQFGENGGNNGTTIVDNSELIIKGGSEGHALDGKGTGIVKLCNGATVNIDYLKDLSIQIEGLGYFTATKLLEGGTIAIDAATMPEGTENASIVTLPDATTLNALAAGNYGKFVHAVVSGNTLKMSKDETFAKIGDEPYLTLEAAIGAANPGDTIVLTKDVILSNLIKLEKPVTLDLNGKTVTGSAQKAFEIYADTTIKNGKIVNTNSIGRCVDTRTAVELNLENVELTATGSGNTQPVTIGGSTDGTVVKLTGCNVNAGSSGYSIISFVECDVEVTNSNLTGYGNIYLLVGSDSSTVNVNGSSVLTSAKVDDNSYFASIVFENSNNSAVTVASAASINAGEYAVVFSTLNGSAYQNTVNMNGAVSAASGILKNYVQGTSTVTTTSDSVKTALEAEGYALTEDGGVYTISGLKADEVKPTVDANTVTGATGVDNDVVDKIKQDIVKNENIEKVETNLTAKENEESINNAAAAAVEKLEVSDSASVVVTGIDTTVKISAPKVEKQATIEVNGEDVTVPKEMTFDVTPVAITTVTVHENGSSTPKTLPAEPVENLAKPVTFRLPVSSLVPVGTIANVYHKGVPVGIHEVKGDNKGHYIEVTSQDFSPFKVSLLLEGEKGVASIDGNKFVSLQDAIDAATAAGGGTITLIDNVEEAKVLITQTEGVNLIIDGQDNTFKGKMVIYGQKRAAGAETLLIQDINFVAPEGAEGCIVSPSTFDGYEKESYSHNVTVSRCDFSGGSRNATAAIRMKQGEDRKWIIDSCTASGNLHSFIQAAGVQEGLTIRNCTVSNLAEGINLNQSVDILMEGNTISAEKYAVRIGASKGTATASAKILKMNNNILTATASDGSAVIVRCTALNATVNMEENTVSGATHISGTTEATKVHADKNYWDGKAAPVISGTKVPVASYYADAARTDLRFTTDAVAQVDNESFLTIEEAIAAAGSTKTIVLRKNVPEVLENSAPIVFTAHPIKVDLNGHKLRASFAGTIIMNGGTYNDANIVDFEKTGKPMIAPLGTTGYDFLSNNGVFEVSPAGINIVSGYVTLGQSTGTQIGHTLTVKEGAEVLIPAGKNLALRGPGIVDGGKLTTQGAIMLEAGTKDGTAYSATLKAPAGLNVIVCNCGKPGCDGAGLIVAYDGTMYKLVSDSVVATVGSTTYTNIGDALQNVPDGGTVYLAADVNVGNINMDKNITLDLNGKTLTGKVTVTGNATVKDSANRTSINLPEGGDITYDANGTAKVEPKFNSTNKYRTANLKHIQTNGIANETFVISENNAHLTLTKAGVVGRVITEDATNGKGEITTLNAAGTYNFVANNNVNTHVHSSGTTLKFTSNMFFETFSSLHLDGSAAALRRDVDYIAGKGSTVITMSNTLLNKLSSGMHTLTMVGKDGKSTSVNFYITVNANADKTNPKTGDEIALPMFVMFSTAAALAVLVMGKKKHF